MIESGFIQPIKATFGLIKSVYESTDSFSSDFGEDFPSPAALEGRLSEIEKLPGNLFLVSRENDELSGFLFVLPRRAGKLRHTADLNMGVLDKARRRGEGGRLLSAALSQLRLERIIEIVYLMVRADNHPALQLYRTRGFEEIARLARDTKIGEHYFDGILMRMWI